MNTQTALTTVGALILLLGIIGVVSMMFTSPSIPNTGGSATTSVGAMGQDGIQYDQMIDGPTGIRAATGGGDLMIEPAVRDHSE